MCQLIVIGGPATGQKFDLTDVTRARIGSGSDASIRMAGTGIGEIQAELTLHEGRFVLTTTHPLIPMFINGQPLSGDTVLQRGDVIVAADVMLMFNETNDRPDRAPSGISLPALDDEAPHERRVRFYDNAQKLLESFDQTSNPTLYFGSLVQVARALMSHLSPGALMPRILEIVFEVIPADRGTILLAEAPDPKLRPVATRVRQDVVSPLGDLASRTIVTHALTRREGVLTLDAKQDARFGPQRSIEELDIHSALCVPLVSNTEVLGVIYLDSTAGERQFTEDHLRLLTGIAVFASMAIENARMVAEISHKRRLDYELEVAAKIQRNLTPHEPPKVTGLELAGRSVAAAEICGDYYDFLLSEDGEQLYTVIGDVSGHGVPAGLVMTMARSYLLGLTGFGISTRELMSELNRLLCPDTRREGMFMSALLLSYDITFGTFSWTGAGHEHLLVYRAEAGTVERIPAGGTALGMRPEISDAYAQNQLSLFPGDVLLLYTDGVTEAASESGAQFSLEALEDRLTRFGQMSADQIVRSMLLELQAHMGGAGHDDQTLLAIKKI